jgi:hypothetical protein
VTPSYPFGQLNILSPEYPRAIKYTVPGIPPSPEYPLKEEKMSRLNILSPEFPEFPRILPNLIIFLM